MWWIKVFWAFTIVLVASTVLVHTGKQEDQTVISISFMALVSSATLGAGG